MRVNNTCRTSTPSLYSSKYDLDIGYKYPSPSGNDYSAYKNSNYPQIISGERETVIDIDGLLNDINYRKAPPDIYKTVGVNSFNNDRIYVGAPNNDKTINIIHLIKITKNPYFDGVSLPAGDNIFNVKKTGNNIAGDLTIPYVMNGLFTPYNTIHLQVSSLNNFDRTGPGAKRIPYTLSTTMGSQTLRRVSEHNASAGSSSSGIFTLHDLQKDAYAIQGHFDARFLAEGSTTSGEYTDTLTAIFTISL